MRIKNTVNTTVITVTPLYFGKTAGASTSAPHYAPKLQEDEMLGTVGAKEMLEQCVLASRYVVWSARWRPRHSDTLNRAAAVVVP